MLLSGCKHAPQMIIIGCQEMVDLNASNILQTNSGKSREIARQWRHVFEEGINKYFLQKGMLTPSEQYTCLFQKEMVGLLSVVLIKETISDRISNISADSVKCGLGNQLGNKGGVLISIRIDSTSLCFVNCHLDAG